MILKKYVWKASAMTLRQCSICFPTAQLSGLASALFLVSCYPSNVTSDSVWSCTLLTPETQSHRDWSDKTQLSWHAFRELGGKKCKLSSKRACLSSCAERGEARGSIQSLTSTEFKYFCWEINPQHRWKVQNCPIASTAGPGQLNWKSCSTV